MTIYSNFYCPSCNKIISYKNKSKHMRTKKHKTNEKNLIMLEDETPYNKYLKIKYLTQ